MRETETANVFSCIRNATLCHIRSSSFSRKHDDGKLKQFLSGHDNKDTEINKKSSVSYHTVSWKYRSLWEAPILTKEKKEQYKTESSIVYSCCWLVFCRNIQNSSKIYLEDLINRMIYHLEIADYYKLYSRLNCKLQIILQIILQITWLQLPLKWSTDFLRLWPSYLKTIRWIVLNSLLSKSIVHCSHKFLFVNKSLFFSMNTRGASEVIL